MITLYFEKADSYDEFAYTVSDTYYDESIYLKETGDGKYLCIFDEEMFVRQEAYAYFIKNGYIDLKKDYVYSFDEATSDGLVIEMEVDFHSMFKKNTGLYEECRNEFEPKMRRMYDSVFRNYRPKRNYGKK